MRGETNRDGIGRIFSSGEMNVSFCGAEAANPFGYAGCCFFMILCGLDWEDEKVHETKHTQKCWYPRRPRPRQRHGHRLLLLLVVVLVRRMEFHQWMR